VVVRPEWGAVLFGTLDGQQVDHFAPFKIANDRAALSLSPGPIVDSNYPRRNLVRRVSTLGQFVDLRGRDVRRFVEIELLQRLRAW
jgi:hypothetical protein